jgi:hypothetical protein
MDLGGKWLPQRARASVEQVQWSFSATNRALRGWVLFDDLRAEKRTRR